MPIINHSGKDIFLKKGQKLGEIRELDLIDGINAKENLPLQFADIEIQPTNQEKTFSESDIRRTDKQVDKIRDMVSAYRNKIAQIPISVPADVSIEHTIELRDDSPVSTQPRRIPYSQREEIQKKTDELIENDLVEPSRSPYGAGVIPVLKSDGTLPICVDYRALNAKTIPRPFPIPRCEDLLEKI